MSARSAGSASVDTRRQLADMRAALRHDLNAAMTRQRRLIVYPVIGLLLSMSALLIAISSLRG